MEKAVENLLKPYAQFFERMASKWQVTVASKILIAEAKHVAAIRAAAIEPRGGWKNKLPLEHSSYVGAFIKACRTNDYTHLNQLRSTACKNALREIDALLNAESIFACDLPSKNMTVDQLIDWAASEMS